MRRNKEEKSIVIMGASVSSGNRGVMALGLSLVQIIHKNFPNYKIVFLVGAKKTKLMKFRIDKDFIEVPVINYRMSPKACLKEHLIFILFVSIMYKLLPFKKLRNTIKNRVPFIQCVKDATFVGDIRGGDSFSDIYGLIRYIMGSLPILVVIMLKGNLIQLPQTYGPFKNVFSKLIAKFIFNRSSVIMARDEDSKKVAIDMTNNSDKIIYSADVAFEMESIKPKDYYLYEKIKLSSNKIIIGINVNGLLYNGGYNKKNMFKLVFEYKIFLQKLIEELCKKYDLIFVFVPHTIADRNSVESDNEASRKLLQIINRKYHNNLFILDHNYGPSEIKGFIGVFDFFIGSRMHSCIAALSQNIPCIGVAYSKKFYGVFETVSVEDCVIDARTMNLNDSIDRIIQKLQNREYIKKILIQNSLKAKQSISYSFNQILQE